ncbi:MAG TPA: type II toxin-antitoxin system VapC family toxin [Ramlibacter sp.]|nr:type II toxin-antitoxin system VapC family toxin [Ramlibacter sp.]
MQYLLDTNICIYVINQRPSVVLAQFLAHEDEGIAISSISAAELHFGVRKSGSARNLRALENFLAPLMVLDFDLDAARVCGDLRAALERKGVPIGPYDTQIAAHALATGLTLVTNNEREFKRVPGLSLENWAV